MGSHERDRRERYIPASDIEVNAPVAPSASYSYSFSRSTFTFIFQLTGMIVVKLEGYDDEIYPDPMEELERNGVRVQFNKFKIVNDSSTSFIVSTR